MQVLFLGCADEQATFGGHSDPRECLTIGETYMIDTIKVNDWTTSITLQKTIGTFNSVCFALVSASAFSMVSDDG